jgi:ABC-type Mn2+/Zn2+ transport system ATPase subunit
MERKIEKKIVIITGPNGAGKTKMGRRIFVCFTVASLTHGRFMTMQAKSRN